MAAYTADAGQAGAPVRLNHVGITAVKSTYNAAGVTVSSGDTYLMAKIPNGVEIVRLGFFGRSSGTGGIVFNLGTSADASLFGAVTISGTTQFIQVNNASATQQLPYKVSLSDDAVPLYRPLLLTVASGTGTATASFGLLVEYLAPGQAGV